MSAGLVALEPSVVEDLAARGIRHTYVTLAALVSVARADGTASLPIWRVCQMTGLKQRQVLNHYNALEASGYVQRIDGGYRGMALVFVVKRWVKDASAFIDTRAKRAIYLARRLRFSRLIEAKRARKKGAMDCTPLISSRGGQASNDALAYRKHDFAGIDGVDSCHSCGLPQRNSRHLR